ncbi:MAG: Rieske (2Fe-2S) protein [Pseudomonadota bacterium]
MIAAIPMNALHDGGVTACRLDGVEVLICRVDGRYFAVSNRCSHAEQALHTGRLRGCELTCPLHGARFDVRDGRCLRGPATTGIVSFPVTLEGGKVHVAVDRPRRLAN